MSTDELWALYEPKKAAIRARLRDFRRVPEHEYAYELFYCLMTPQSSAVNAGRAIEVLREHRFESRSIDPEPLLHQEEFYIRFHRTKARHLLSAKEQFAEIRARLALDAPSREHRSWLVENVKGLGWKEASHFLRNIGHRDLAILDRHILRNLLRIGVLRSLPASLTAKRYLAIEAKFIAFSASAGIPMDELDLLFWSMETGEILK
jgi:N-glycosylase/DNA lyase